MRKAKTQSGRTCHFVGFVMLRHLQYKGIERFSVSPFKVFVIFPGFVTQPHPPHTDKRTLSELIYNKVLETKKKTFCHRL